MPFGIVACTFSDNLSRNSCIRREICPPPNNFDRHVQRPRSPRYSSVQCVHFRSIKRKNYSFMASMNLLEIDALGRLKMLFQRPYISKPLEGACPLTPLAARVLGARDCPPLNLTLLRHCIFSKACKEVKMGNSLQQYRLVVGIYWSAFCLFH